MGFTVFAQRQKERAAPVCTSRSCPTFDAAKYLQQLRQTLPYVSPVPIRELTALHHARDYRGIVALIKRMMSIEGRLTVAWVNSGGQKEVTDAPAWIQMPKDMPFYGTQAFQESAITMYIRKSRLDRYTYDQVAIMIAHELSHVVLNSIRHPLHGCEKAVDLTAMLLGFRLLYVSGCYKERHSQNSIQIETLGYLSQQEVELANDLLTPARPKTTFSSTAAKVAAAIRRLIERRLKGS